MLGKEENQEQLTSTEAVSLVTKEFIDNFIVDYDKCVDEPSCEFFLQSYKKFFDNTLNEEASFLALLAQSSEKAAIINSVNESIGAQLPKDLTPEQATFFLLKSTFTQVKLFLVSLKVQLIENKITSTTDYNDKLGSLSSLRDEYIDISKNLLDKDRELKRKTFTRYFTAKTELLESNHNAFKSKKKQNVAQSPCPKTPAKNNVSRAQSTLKIQDKNSSQTSPPLVSKNGSDTSNSQKTAFQAKKLFVTPSTSSANTAKKNTGNKKARTQKNIDECASGSSTNNQQSTPLSEKDQQLVAIGNIAAQSLLNLLSADKGNQQLNTNSQNSTADTNQNNSNHSGKPTQTVEPVSQSISTGQSMPQLEKSDDTAEKADVMFANPAPKSTSKSTTNTNLSAGTTKPNVNNERRSVSSTQTVKLALQPTSKNGPVQANKIQSTLFSALDLATDTRPKSDVNGNLKNLDIENISSGDNAKSLSFTEKQSVLSKQLAKKNNDIKPSSQSSSTINNIVDQNNTQNSTTSNKSINPPANKPEFLAKIIKLIPELKEKNDNYLAREEAARKFSKHKSIPITDAELKELPSHQLGRLIDSLERIDREFNNDSNDVLVKKAILNAVDEASPVLSQERKFWGRFVNRVNLALNFFTCGFFGKSGHITDGKSKLNQIEDIINKEITRGL